MLPLFLLLTLFIGSHAADAADGYTCDTPTTITPPEDLDQTVYWPANWNDSMPPKNFPVGQQCNWEVTVPDGYYAYVIFYKVAPDANIFMEYPNVQAEKLLDNDQNPYILTSPKFTVTIFKAQTVGAFSFKINWFKYPEVSNDKIKVLKGAAPIAQVPDVYLTTFFAETNVSFVAFTLKDASQNTLLRQSAVFDGDSTSGKFLGSLNRIMLSNKPVISTGNSLSVYTFGLKDTFNYNLYMAQDHSNDQGLFTYKAINCPSDTVCPVEINSRFGTSALATADPRPEFIKSISLFPEGATLKVYEGAMIDQNLVTTLTNDNYKNRLPMELKNTMRQYVLDSGNLVFELSRDANDAKWNQLYDGRKGFVHSFYHGVLNNQQGTDETFTTGSTDKLFLNYIVRDADFTGDMTTLTVIAKIGGSQVSSAVYNKTNLPPSTTISIQGDTFEVKYQSNGVQTKGFRVDFSTTATGYVTSTPAPSTSRSTRLTTGTTLTTTPPSVTSSSSSAPSSTPAPSTASSPIPSTESTPRSMTVTSPPRVETTTKSSSLPSFILIITGSLLLVLF